MKKRCTNPSCRRVFTPVREGGAVKCPHCGRLYGAAGLVSVELVGYQSKARIPLIKALRGRDDMNLREAKELVDRLPKQPLLLGNWKPEEAAAVAQTWEARGALVRLSEPNGAQATQPPETFAVVMTGYRPGKRAAALAMVHRKLGNQRQTVMAVRNIRSQEVLLGEQLSRADAEALAARAAARGVHAHIRWQRAG